MARNRDPRDTDSDDAVPTVGAMSSQLVDVDDTSVAVELIGREIDRVQTDLRRTSRRADAFESRVRELETYRAALEGIPGHLGTFAQIQARAQATVMDVARVEEKMRTETARLESKINAQDSVILKLDRVHWKLLVAGTLTGSIVGALVSFALKVLG